MQWLIRWGQLNIFVAVLILSNKVKCFGSGQMAQVTRQLGTTDYTPSAGCSCLCCVLFVVGL